MGQEEFLLHLDKIYKEFRRTPDNFQQLISHYGEDLIQKINNYIIDNCRNEDIMIKVFSYELRDEKIFLRTELGTFLLDFRAPHTKNIMDELEKNYINQNYGLMSFFEKLFHNNVFYAISIDNIDLISYLNAYYRYRMLRDPSQAKRLFINYSTGCYSYSYFMDRSIPLEYLNHRNFNHFRMMDKNYAKFLREIYDRFYQFNNNSYLVFSMIVLLNLNGKEKMDYIIKNIKKFKLFVFDKAENRHLMTHCYDFIKNNDLLQYFTDEDLKKLYKLAPDFYFKKDRELFSKIASSIENNSDLVSLNEKGQMVHIRYYDYDLYEGVPVASRKLDLVALREQNKGQKNKSFLDYFFYGNEVIAKLYQYYYLWYKKLINDHSDRNNLENFLKSILQPKNLIYVYHDSRFSWQDLEKLSVIGEYYGVEQEKHIKDVKAECRKRSLAIYNCIVRAQGDEQVLNEVLRKINLNKDSIYSYIINNRFLFSKEKEALLKICGRYYSDGLKIMDIFLLLDEMLTRELRLEEILKERELPQKEFYKIYNDAKENNPILHQYIFESLSQNKRRGYLKLLKLGYVVLSSGVGSLEKYQQRFSQDFYQLLSALDGTELFSRLYEMAGGWKDFEASRIKRNKKGK